MSAHIYVYISFLIGDLKIRSVRTNEYSFVLTLLIFKSPIYVGLDSQLPKVYYSY